MHRSWTAVVEPLIDAAAPRAILAVSHDGRELAHRLAGAVADGAAVATVADDALAADAGALDRLSAGRLTVRPGRAPRVAQDVGPVDVALLSGHPNWYTTIHLLRGLESAAAAAGQEPPVVVVADVRWPFGRRDGYRDLDEVPEDARHPAVRLGLLPGRRSPVENGVETGLWHATADHGPRNGVRTAIDDHLAETPVEYRLVDLPGFGGLAVLAPQTRVAARPQLGDLIDRLRSPAFLEDHCRRVDLARVASLAAAATPTVPPAPDQRLRLELDALRASVRAGAQRVSELERALAAARAGQAHVDELRSALDEGRREREAAERALCDLRDETGTLRAERDRLRERVAAFERAEHGGSLVEHELRESRRRLQSRLDAATEEHGRLRLLLARSQDVQGELDAARARLTELQVERDALRAEAQRAADLARELESRDVELRAARRQEQQLTGRLGELNADLDAARLQLAELENALGRTLDDRDEIRRQVERARQSRAWRLGHGTTKLLRRLTFRRMHGTSALDRALERLDAPVGLPAPSPPTPDAVAETRSPEPVDRR